MKYSHRYWLLLYFLLLQLLPVLSAQEKKHEAVSGHINLQNWNPETEGVVYLDGEWEFYWHRLLTPDDFNNPAKPPATGLVNVPNEWNIYRITNNERTGNGYATYRLIIELGDRPGIYSLKIRQIETAYRLWMNNKLLIEAGKVANNESDFKAAWQPHTLTFHTNDKQLELVIQVANHGYYKGGIPKSIILGLPSHVAARLHRNIGFGLFIFGLLFLIAFYHLGAVVIRRKDMISLFLSIICIITIFSLITINASILVHVLPNIDLTRIIILRLSSYFVWFIFFMLILKYSYRHIPNYLSRIVLCWGIFSIVFLFVLPVAFLQYIRLLFYSVAILFIFYALYIVFDIIKGRKFSALLMFAGTLALLVTLINDLLYSYFIIESILLLPVGMFVYVFSLSAMLYIHSTQSFVEVKTLSNRLLSLGKIKDELLIASSYRLNQPLRVIVENVGAKKGYLLMEKGGKWVIEAEVDISLNNEEDLSMLSIPVENYGRQSEIPKIPESIIDYVVRTKKRVLLDDTFKDGRFIIDDYVEQRQVQSVLCLPLQKNNGLIGILYLENDMESKVFTDEKLKVLDLLSSQFSTFIDNAKIYHALEDLNKSLEMKVKERTKEIVAINTRLEKQRAELIKKNKNTLKSIKYAERIQKSIFPSEEKIKRLLPDSFLFFKPKEILSGDFYWIQQFPPESISENMQPVSVIFAAADCTGHGVPGALLSIVGCNLLNYAVNQLLYTQPNDILYVLQEGLKETVGQSGNTYIMHDGMDIALINYEIVGKKIQYAGAQNPLYLIRNGELTIIEGDKISIGMSAKNKLFTNNEIDVQTGDMIYLFSDGYADQFGGPRSRKFMYNTFKKLLLSIYQKDMDEQKQILNDTFSNWKNDSVQIDDVMVIGIRI